MHFCSWRYNDGGLGTLKFTAANSPCPSTLLQLAADASWSGTTIKYGMAPNSDRHKIVFACAYSFDTTLLAGSRPGRVMLPDGGQEVGPGAREGSGRDPGGCFECGILHNTQEPGPHGQHGTVKGHW